MVIGGSDVFADTMPLADRLEITHVHAAPEGDAFFPPIDPAVWREVAREEHAGRAGGRRQLRGRDLFKALGKAAKTRQNVRLAGAL